MRTRIAAACVAGLLLLTPVAMAQYGALITPDPEPNEGEGIAVGPFLFSPSLHLTWEHRDNIFYTADDKVADDLYVARAILMFELPIYDNYVRFIYRPQYREYNDYDFQENWTHPLEVIGAFDFPSGLKLTPRYQYFSGALEVRQVDPGGELMYGEGRFKKHSFDIAADYWFTSRDGIRLDGRYGQLRYDETCVNPTGQVTCFYNYDDLDFGAGWLHQLSPTLVMNLHYRHGELDSKDTLAYRDQTSDDLTIGFEGNVNEVLSSGIEVGWRQTEPDVKTGDPDIQKYSNLLLKGHLGYAMAHGGNLRLNLLFTDYPSNYGANAFYTAYGGVLDYTLTRQRLTAQAQAGYQVNDYDEPDPVSGASRSDDIITFGLGGNYRIGDYISLSAGWRYEDRDTLHEYSYDANSFVLGLVLGFGN